MSPEISTRALLHALVEGSGDRDLSLGDLLDQFQERAFGVFLLISVLPAFVPLPIGAGAISGPLVSLIGLQLLFQLEHPWVPRFLSKRELSRSSVTKFRDRTSRLLKWLEKVSRPRAEPVIDHPVAKTFTGLLLVLLGFLLALPLPATNYPFGLILLAYAIALIERDGRLMLIAWALGIAQLVVMGVFSGQIVSWVMALFH
ncbi:exopolysaccharide biosynthesis protein [Arenimonas sp. MALMAid1274]|uniref:exopolysaccharide biosynthesis protein n=1 Tax=Arenimonas sp. MALMAid1274 TaxID=3411630 RepID=UPI003BA0EC8B